MIETRALTKRFGKLVAVDGLDIEILGPGLVGFVGPNGAGKTTTMRILTGFTSMSSGSAVVAGFDVFEAPRQVKSRVGYLPETPPLYPELRVGEYLRFVAEIRGIRGDARLRRVGQVMEQAGLEGWEGRRLSTLSRGYRQRVGLAQAIVHDPPLLLLDEPTTGLDPVQLVEIRALIRSLAADRTVLLSTHLLSEVETLCDRVLLLDGGRLIADGPAADLASDAGIAPWVELTLDAPTDDVSATIATLDAVHEVVRAQGSYRVRGTDAVEPALGALAGVHGWKIRRLARQEPSLQDIYIALIGGHR